MQVLQMVTMQSNFFLLNLIAQVFVHTGLVRIASPPIQIKILLKRYELQKLSKVFN